MRKYKNVQTSIVPQTIKDEFVTRSRQQAFDIGFSKLLLALLVSGSVFASGFAVKPDMAIKAIPILLILSVAYAINEYSKSLECYTREDREMLKSRYTKTELIIPESEAVSSHDITPIPQPKGNGHYNLHVGLTKTQLEYIASTMLDTKTLTVNYIESLGISRANAERLRVELSEHGLLDFDSKGRVHLTDNGRKTCKRIVK